MREISDVEIIYAMLEKQYLEVMGKEISSNFEANDDIKELYPNSWFSSEDYIKKAEILAKAIERKCLVSKVEGYSDIEKDIRDEKNK